MSSGITVSVELVENILYRLFPKDEPEKIISFTTDLNDEVQDKKVDIEVLIKYAYLHWLKTENYY